MFALSIYSNLLQTPIFGSKLRESFVFQQFRELVLSNSTCDIWNLASFVDSGEDRLAELSKTR